MPAVQRGVADLLEREGVDAVLCGTGFASVQFQEAGLGSPLWDRLAVPVLQLLCSGRGRSQWQESSIGLGPLDLSLQVALPELDGRLTTRVGAFKEMVGTSETLATAIHRYEPDPERLEWIARLTRGWVSLRRTPPARRRVALVLANYPTRNSRLANGVGLDTPASAALMLAWLQEAGYTWGGFPRGRARQAPAAGRRGTDPAAAGGPQQRSGKRSPPGSGPPAPGRLPGRGTRPCPPRDGNGWRGSGVPRRPMRAWSPRETGPGFPIRGLRFGQVCLLIQPSRGYERDPSLSYHSPDLPPTHAYLAQYLWIRGSLRGPGGGARGQARQSGVVARQGPGPLRSVLSGVGSGTPAPSLPLHRQRPRRGQSGQAPRSQAVILDHLTPPLGRAGLHGPMQELEALLDEYWEACQLGGERVALLRERLTERLRNLHFPSQRRGGSRWAGVPGGQAGSR